MLKCGAVIVAAGSGKRMKSTIKKQFLKLEHKEIFALAAERFEELDLISQVILVVSEEDLKETEKIVFKYGFKKTKIVCGGKERQNSVYNGLKALDSDTDIVLIHDGVRPFVSSRCIEDVIKKTEETGACVAAVSVKDTIKVCEKNIIKSTLERDKLYAVQTPQGFSYKAILAVYETLGSMISVTDDSALMEEAGYDVCVVSGSYYNIKITTPEDLIFGEAILKSGEWRNDGFADC